MASESGDWLPEDLGGRLRAVRQRASLTQRGLALAAGIPRSTIGRIESGTAADPRIRTVCRLFAAAGCRVVLDPRPSAPFAPALGADSPTGPARSPAGGTGPPP